MEYKVSDKIQKKFDTLTKDAKVQKALQFMEDDQNEGQQWKWKII